MVSGAFWGGHWSLADEAARGLGEVWRWVPAPRSVATEARREAGHAHDAVLIPRRLPPGSRDERGVHVGGLGPQRLHGALLARPHAERIELEVLHGVEVGDLVDVLVGHAIEILHERLRRGGPRRVRVGVVALPGDVVDVQVVPVLDPERVVDEARDDTVLEDLARELVTEVLPGPLVVVLVDVVDA